MNIIKNPIIDIEFELDQIVGFQNKVNHFKKWLEKFIKYNLAIQFSWLQKNEIEIPPNLRVLIVQFFQKPASLGLCVNISRNILEIINTSEREESKFLTYSGVLSRKIYFLEELVQFRNIDAHGLRELSQNDWDKIFKNISKLIENPFYYSTQICCSSNVSNENLNSNLSIILKENINQVFIEIADNLDFRYSRFNNYSLFPLITCDSSGSLFFWNKKKGNNGIYSMYSDSTTICEIEEITKFIGFPYEDWRNSNNPDFINYLKYRLNAMELLFHNPTITIDIWYTELLVARRLENELNLNKIERISYVWEVDAILDKLKNVDNLEITKKYKSIIFEFHNNLDNLDVNQQEKILRSIIESGLFLIEYYFSLKNYNAANLITCKLLRVLPRFTYSGFSTYDIVWKLWLLYSKKSTIWNFFQINKIPSISTLIIVFILLLFKLSYFSVFIFIVPIWVVSTFAWAFFMGLDLTIFNRNLDKFYENEDLTFTEIQNIIITLKSFGQIKKIKFKLAILLSPNLKSSAIRDLPFLETSDKEWNSLFKNGSLFMNKSSSNYVFTDFISLIGDTKQYYLYYAINCYFNYCLEINEIDRIVEFQIRFPSINKDLNHVVIKKGNVSGYQLENDFYASVFNNMIWTYNCAIVVAYRKNGVSKSYDFNNLIYSNSRNFNNDLFNHYYLFGFICAILNDYQNSIRYFHEALEHSIKENKIYCMYNLMWLYGAIGDVVKYISCCIELNSIIESSNKKIIDKIPNWLIDEIKLLAEEFLDQMKENPTLLNNSLVWVENKIFTLGLAPDLIINSIGPIKVNYQIRDDSLISN